MRADIHLIRSRFYSSKPKELSKHEQKRTHRCTGNQYRYQQGRCRRALGALLDIISDTLKKGDSLSLVGFGTFEVRSRAARTGRNPKTGEALKIKAAKVPAFKPGATLKAAVNSGKK